MVIRLVDTIYTPDMDNLLKLGLAYLLAPSLVAGVAALLATAIGLTFATTVIVLAIAAAVLLIATLGRPLIGTVSRWARSRFSPVRRRHPRPTAWHQWR